MSLKKSHQISNIKFNFQEGKGKKKCQKRRGKIEKLMTHLNLAA